MTEKKGENLGKNWADFSYSDWLENPFACRAPKWALELAKKDCLPVSARDFYTDIFRLSDLSPSEGGIEPHRKKDDYVTGEYGIIAHEINIAKRKSRRMTITNDGGTLWDLIDKSEDFCLLRPISYAGKSAKLEHARFLFALVIEIDDIRDTEAIDELFFKWEEMRPLMPKPTYIVCSGSGLHLYFCFFEPVAMFKKFQQTINAARQYLIPWYWTKGVSKTYPQYEGINQGFRVVGTLAKDKQTRAMAFKVGDKYTISEFNEFLPDECKITQYYKSELSLSEAMQKYPEWYLRRIIRKEPPGTYKRNRAVYDAWKERILKGAEDRHRYNCLEALCALAVQCDIREDELISDCEYLAEVFEARTKRDDNHFTQYDVICALSTYKNADVKAYLRNLDVIKKKTNIQLPRTTRNGQKQADHLEEARAVRDVRMKRQGKIWNGRKPKEDVVKQWRAEHPNGKKAECIRDTGLSKPTVYKWWGE